MLNTDSWKKKAATYEIPADILFITEHTFHAIKTPFAQEAAAEAAIWILIHLLQIEKTGSILCDLALLPASLRLWIPPEQSGEELIDLILCHYPAVLDNTHFISHDPLDTVPVIQVGERFLYLRKNYLLERQFWQLFHTQFIPNMFHDYLGLSLSSYEIENLEKEETNPAVIRALHIIHSSNFLLLTGGPGSGKTYTLAIILKSLIQKARTVHPHQPLKIILAAPTGRAQARMIESLHKNENLNGLEEIPQEGQTLHSLLHYRIDSLDKRPAQLLYADIVAVDEASMIDLHLFHRLFQALPAKTKLILIGDPNQLPSVELGAVLADMLRMRQAKHHLLKDHIVELQGSRRSLNEDIDELARAALIGCSDDFQRFCIASLPAPDQHITGIINTEQLSSAQIIAWLKKQYTQAAPLLTGSFAHRPDEMTRDSSERERLDKFFQFFDSLCILCARKDNHPLSVKALNYALSPKHAPGTLSHGMPIMVHKNMDEYQLTNGERGILLQIQNQLLCCFRYAGNSSGFRTIPLNILYDCIQPCYAMTIHKSQGSEFDHVLIILSDHCEMLMSRSLLFTAITRAKRSLMILTNLKTLDLSLREDIGHISCLSYLFAGKDPSAQKMPHKNLIQDKETGQLALF